MAEGDWQFVVGLAPLEPPYLSHDSPTGTGSFFGIVQAFAGDCQLTAERDRDLVVGLASLDPPYIETSAGPGYDSQAVNWRNCRPAKTSASSTRSRHHRLRFTGWRVGRKPAHGVMST